MSTQEDSYAEEKEVLQEARLVVPGVQMLFSFLLVTVFTESFAKLDFTHHLVHFIAVALSAFTIAVLFLPVAYRSKVDPGASSKHFARFSTRCVKLSLVSFSGALALVIFLIAEAAFQSLAASITLAVVALLGFVFTWFVLPPWLHAHSR